MCDGFLLLELIFLITKTKQFTVAKAFSDFKTKIDNLRL